jgi:hypothetical protein
VVILAQKKMSRKKKKKLKKKAIADNERLYCETAWARFWNDPELGFVDFLVAERAKAVREINR